MTMRLCSLSYKFHLSGRCIWYTMSILSIPLDLRPEARMNWHEWYVLHTVKFTAMASFHFFCSQFHMLTKQMPNVVNLLLVWSMSVKVIHVKKCCPLMYWIVVLGASGKTWFVNWEMWSTYTRPVTNFYCAIGKSDLSRRNRSSG